MIDTGLFCRAQDLNLRIGDMVQCQAHSLHDIDSYIFALIICSSMYTCGFEYEILAQDGNIETLWSRRTRIIAHERAMTF